MLPIMYRSISDITQTRIACEKEYKVLRHEKDTNNKGCRSNTGPVNSVKFQGEGKQTDSGSVPERPLRQGKCLRAVAVTTLTRGPGDTLGGVQSSELRAFVSRNLGDLR